LLIINQSSRPIYLQDLELRTPWEDQLFDWLTPETFTFRRRKGRDTTYEAYAFPETGLQWRKQELNHRLQDGSRLTPKRPMRGLLLGIGSPMPANLQAGQLLGATLAIVGSDHTEYTQEVDLWTERLPYRPTGIHRGGGLRAGVQPFTMGNPSPTPQPVLATPTLDVSWRIAPSKAMSNWELNK
jgi:hypothetical protein